MSYPHIENELIIQYPLLIIFTDDTSVFAISDNYSFDALSVKFF